MDYISQDPLVNHTPPSRRKSKADINHSKAGFKVFFFFFLKYLASFWAEYGPPMGLA